MTYCYEITLVVRSILEEDSGLLIAAVVGLTVAAVVVGLFIWMRPQWVRLTRLREMFPDAVVLGAQSYSGLGYTIGEVLGRGIAGRETLVGTYFVVVVDSDGVSFWKGWRTPQRRHVIPWEFVNGVKTNNLALARELPSIEIAVGSPHVDRQEISFCPCREGWRVGFALLDPRDVDVWTEAVRRVFVQHT